MKQLRIIGVGSPFGDDRLGWQAISLLTQSPVVGKYAAGVALITLDRPGTRLLDEFAGADAIILLDAIRAGAPPGTLHCLRDRAAFSVEGSLSSHGIGVAQALALADAMGCLPTRWTVFGLEMGAHAKNDDVDLSPCVKQALPRLVAMVEREVTNLYGSPLPVPASAH